MEDAWNPAQYEKFRDQRAKPFWDVLGLINLQGVETAIDLGCGTGELTRELHRRVNAFQMIGIDSSKKMLEKSEGFSAPGLEYKHFQIEKFLPSRPVDLVFSNAALQWCSDHESLVPKILSWVKPGGQVAIQVPANFDHPSHRIAEEVATDLFQNQFEARAPSVLPVERYATLLYQNGFSEQRCRLEIYGHPMASGADVVEWTKGTLLTHYQKHLKPDQFDHFLLEYRERLLEMIGEGPYFYPFKRILFWGRKDV